jgi:Tol biopolymer transport system component
MSLRTDCSFTASDARKPLGWRLILIMLALAVVAGLAGASRAHATYPGANGRITFGRFDPAVGDFHIYAANPDGSHEVQLTTVLSEVSDWSPSGSRIAFDFVDPNGNVEIATLDPTNPSNVSQLTTAPGFHGEPNWSPDGTTIAFDSDLGDHPAGEGIYLMNSSDGGNLVRTTANPYGWFDIDPVWSPGGQWIAFSRIKSITPVGPAGGRPRERAISALFLVHPDGSGLRRVTPWGIDIAGPDWSPDGQSIAFSAKENFPAPAQIWLIRADGSNRHAITNVTRNTGFGQPVFSPDGTKIIAEGRLDPNGDRQLWMMNADGSGLHVLSISGVALSFPDWGTAPIQE